ncbi:MAG: Outer rane lipoprotein [Pseudomonadota bacterium]
MLKKWEFRLQPLPFTRSLGLPYAVASLLGTLTLSCASAPAPVQPETVSVSEKKNTVASPASSAKDSGESKKGPDAENAQPVASAHSGNAAAQQQPLAVTGKSSDTNSSTQKSNPQQDAELASLRVEVMSLNEKVLSLQRKLDVVLKAQRSGLLEFDGAEGIRSAVEKMESKRASLPPLGSQGPLDRFENDFDNDSREHLKTPESPQKLVDRGVTLLAQRDFGRVVQALEDFQNRFPNSPLSNTAELTLAEAYVELKSPQLALPHLRAFYLQHPNDPQMHKAKWLEAQTQEQLRAAQKAAQLYREVIALAPDSELALRSRASLERLSGSLQQ